MPVLPDACLRGNELRLQGRPEADSGRAGTAGYKLDVGISPVTDVDAMVRVRHPQTKQLSVKVKGPDGTKVKLSKGDTKGENLGQGACKDPPQQSDDFPDFTVFDDDATDELSAGSAPYASGFEPSYDGNSFLPRGDLLAFDGIDSVGKWRITVKDTVNGREGDFLCARIAVSDDN